MKKILGMAVLAAGMALCACAEGPEEVPLSSPSQNLTVAEVGFGPLAGLAGTRWYGEPDPADTGQTQTPDYSEWSWDLGGQALVKRHVTADGTYGGVTYFQTTPMPGVLNYVYVTSARFQTTGTVVLHEDGSWSSESELEGLDHIDKVRSTSRLNEDGTIVMLSEFHDPDKGWQPGNIFIYMRTDDPLPELLPEGDAAPDKAPDEAHDKAGE